MRLPIEKPSNAVMRFFTPELYEQFNSSNEEEADRADQAWEAAIQEYHLHLKDIWDRLPSQVRKLTELCLHDAELLSCRSEAEPVFSGPSWSAVALLSLKQHEQVTTLIYGLWDRLREFPPRRDWRFSKERKHWMYDEVDAVDAQRGFFAHRILFSDGSIVEVPFASVLIHRLML
ncbi:MAG TPA: hypothetical protein VH682_13555 [Gemmataceae bacterium]